MVDKKNTQKYHAKPVKLCFRFLRFILFIQALLLNLSHCIIIDCENISFCGHGMGVFFYINFGIFVEI